MFPIKYLIIDKYQWKDKELVEKLKHESYHIKYFCGGVKVTQLICISEKKYAKKYPRGCVKVLAFITNESSNG